MRRFENLRSGALFPDTARLSIIFSIRNSRAFRSQKTFFPIRPYFHLS